MPAGFRGRRSRNLEPKPKLIADHGDKLAVRGLAARALDRVTEVGAENVHVASVPRDLDRVANGPLHAGRGGFIHLRNGGIEHLRYRAHHVGRVHGHNDRAAQILITLDMGGNADLVHNVGNDELQVARFIFIDRDDPRPVHPARKAQDPFR